MDDLTKHVDVEGLYADLGGAERLIPLETFQARLATSLAAMGATCSNSTPEKAVVVPRIPTLNTLGKPARKFFTEGVLGCGDDALGVTHLGADLAVYDEPNIMTRAWSSEIYQPIEFSGGRAALPTTGEALLHFALEGLLSERAITIESKVLLEAKAFPTWAEYRDGSMNRVYFNTTFDEVTYGDPDSWEEKPCVEMKGRGHADGGWWSVLKLMSHYGQTEEWKFAFTETDEIPGCWGVLGFSDGWIVVGIGIRSLSR